jgi:hypothetical protein
LRDPHRSKSSKGENYVAGLENSGRKDEKKEREREREREN